MQAGIVAVLGAGSAAGGSSGRVFILASCQFCVECFGRKLGEI